MAKRTLNRLTARTVETLKAPGWHSDGGGLYLRIDSDGRKRWVLVYFANKRRREMGLGAATGAGAVSLTLARKAAQDAQGKAKAGIDPLVDREATKAAEAALKAFETKEASMPTFGAFADAYVETMRPSWRNKKHAAQWVMTLTKYCAPIRDRRIDAIGTEDVLEVLQPIWSKLPETAQRLRGRIENVLDAAKAKGHRTGENPARWRGHLDSLLPERQKLTRGHHAAMPYEDMPGFMAALRERDAIAARLLEFTILTAARTGEAIGARWDEFDLERGDWSIPAKRMKAGKPHRVPLSPRALAIVTDMAAAKVGPYVFPGRGKAALSNMAMAKVLERMGRDGVTVHGFRSAFRDWAAEVSTFPHEVCEMALAHTIGNKAEAAYRRGDLFEKRRALMTAWAAHCEPKPANVVPLKGRKAT
jgi:integrase